MVQQKARQTAPLMAQQKARKTGLQKAPPIVQLEKVRVLLLTVQLKVRRMVKRKVRPAKVLDQQQRDQQMAQQKARQTAPLMAQQKARQMAQLD